MPINPNAGQPVALFLFAHQDDECGVFYEIEKSVAQPYRVVCLYLTDGSYGGADPEVRNRESRGVLTKLGVKDENIHFLGSALSIRDTQLCFSIPAATSTVAELLNNHPIASVYCPAWEGGHPDHDALYIIASLLIEQKGIRGNCWQYPLYHGAKMKHPFFRVLRPLAENGSSIAEIIPLRKRFAYLRYCASYKSQIKTWIGLLPFFAWHYLTDGHQYLQPIRRLNHDVRPHAGPLYYEKRGFLTWKEFENATQHLSPHDRNSKRS
jgi:LmbE family N-acetylglucosaminyl deacetylase